MPDFSQLSDLKLIDAETQIHGLFDRTAAAGYSTIPHEKAHDLVTKELRERGLMYEPLDKALRTTGIMNTATGKDDDSDDDQTNNASSDPDNDGGVSQGSESGNSEDRSPTEAQSPDGKPPVTDGPYASVTHWVYKSVGGVERFVEEPINKEESAPVRGTHPSKDDGLNQKGKTKRGKGGEVNRTQDSTTTSVKGDKDDENDGTMGIIKAEDFDPAAFEVYSICKSAGVPTPHEFQPVRNICRNCRQSGEGHDGDHDFVPVRDVCRVCKGGQAIHKSVALWTDGSLWKELPTLSNEDRMKMAEQGIALPDGSFPIPNEAFLHAAIGLVGQAPDPQAAMNHIIERAQAMGMEHALPAAWGVQGPSAPGAPAAGPGAHAVGAAGPGNTPATASNAGPATPPGKTGLPVPGGGPGAPAGPGVGGGSQGPDGAGPTTANADAPPGDPMDPTKKPLATQGAMMKALGSPENPVQLVDIGDIAIIKALTNDGDRYTLAPVYMPDTPDAHDEWATADDLQKSMWNYVEKTGSDRTVFLQHSPHPAGKWVDIVTWPFPVAASMQKSVDGISKAVPVTFPAKTVYMGIRWEPWAFKEILDGKLNGLSMGGSAPRVEGSPGVG